MSRWVEQPAIRRQDKFKNSEVCTILCSFALFNRFDFTICRRANKMFLRWRRAAKLEEVSSRDEHATLSSRRLLRCHRGQRGDERMVRWARRGENQRQRCHLISRPHRLSPPSVRCPSLRGGSSARPRPRIPSVRQSQARANFRARALGGFSCLGAEPVRGEGEVTERGQQQQQQRGIRVRCVNKFDGGEHNRRAKWVDSEVRW